MSLLNQFKQVKCFVFDVDGVLTGGSLLLLSDGQMARTMNIKDGYALQLAIKEGYHIVIISGAGNDGVKQRLERLGITDIYFNEADKQQVLTVYLQTKNLLPAQVLFMGDDIPDYKAMKATGLPCCPADAVPEIKIISKYIARMGGGQGCVREVIEKVLKLNGQWHMDTAVASK